jgi:hypothetical protein
VKQSNRLCSISGCGYKYYSKSFCRKHYNYNYLKENPDKINTYRIRHKESHIKSTKAWRERNQEHVLEYSRNYREKIKSSPTLKEKQTEYRRERARKPERKEYLNKWFQTEKGKRLKQKHRNKRIEKLKLHTPKWQDVKQLKDFYKNRPQGHHIDHIIPLQGENVSGLNVIGNLQYLPASENIRKSNKYE